MLLSLVADAVGGGGGVVVALVGFLLLLLLLLLLLIIFFFLHQAPRSRLFVSGLSKLSCSTPFTHFSCLVSVHRPFHVYFIANILSMVLLFPAAFLQLISV